ncbi:MULTISPECIES: hypothetical protein [unclassified Pantoea]|uniref:hypothetical protein n=1 Tax=unclassified Pantoea TaxID=2630326 RepID=UPI00211998AC|nr:MULTISPECIES: hypothetical protein [unclassified Pantoea]
MANNFERVEIDGENGSVNVKIFDYPTKEKGWKRLSGRDAHIHINLPVGDYSDAEIMQVIKEYYEDMNEPMPDFDEVYDHRNDKDEE